MDLKCINEQKSTPIPKRPLGSTDISIPIIGLGGQGSLESQGDEKNCIEIIERAYELGIRYVDCAPIYKDSEIYYGKALKGIRNKIFLATKTDDRTRDGSLKLLEKSLKRLQTDYIDLWQIHHIEDIENVNKATSDDGALQALIEMQEQGVVKFLGFTGHEDPKPLMEMLNRYQFDTVLCPINAADRNMNPSFIDTVVRKANQKKMGVIGMKVFAQGYIFNKILNTAWEPLTYTLSQPISNVIIGIDTIEQLEENVAIAKSFAQMTKGEMAYTESKTKNNLRRACFFRSKYGGYDSKNKLEPLIIGGK